MRNSINFSFVLINIHVDDFICYELAALPIIEHIRNLREGVVNIGAKRSIFALRGVTEDYDLNLNCRMFYFSIEVRPHYFV